MGMEGLIHMRPHDSSGSPDCCMGEHSHLKSSRAHIGRVDPCLHSN